MKVVSLKQATWLFKTLIGISYGFLSLANYSNYQYAWHVTCKSGDSVSNMYMVKYVMETKNYPNYYKQSNRVSSRQKKFREI